MSFDKSTLGAMLLIVAAVGLPSPGEAHRSRALQPHNRALHRGRVVYAPTAAHHAAWYAATHGRPPSGAEGPTNQILLPPTFATSPRTYGATYGPNYFDRTMDSGTAKRGLAYNVRRRL